jgi:cyanate permease
MPGFEQFERPVVTLAVIFSTAGMIGFAFAPPADPWWWAGLFAPVAAQTSQPLRYSLLNRSFASGTSTIRVDAGS